MCLAIQMLEIKQKCICNSFIFHSVHAVFLFFNKYISNALCMLSIRDKVGNFDEFVYVPRGRVCNLIVPNPCHWVDDLPVSGRLPYS